MSRVIAYRLKLFGDSMIRQLFFFTTAKVVYITVMIFFLSNSYFHSSNMIFI